MEDSTGEGKQGRTGYEPAKVTGVVPTCDDVDVRVQVLREADSCAVPLKGIPKLFLYRR